MRRLFSLLAALALSACATGGTGPGPQVSPDQVLAAAEQAYLAAGPAEATILADPAVAEATKVRILDADAAAYRAIKSAEDAQDAGLLTTSQGLAALAQGALSGLNASLVDGQAEKARAASKPKLPSAPRPPVTPSLPPPAPLTTPAPIAGPTAMPAPGGSK